MVKEIKYREIYTVLKTKIIDGTWQKSQKIPNVLELCKEFECSRMTMKKALDLLVDEGLLFRKRGQGSFVMSNVEQKNILSINERSLEGLTKSSHGKATTKVLSFQLIFATKKIAQALEIRMDDPVYEIIRVHSINSRPYVIEKTYMAVSAIPGINSEVLKGSIYEYIEKILKLRIASARKITRADISNQQDHQILHLKENEPVLEIEQIAYLDNGKPFEYSFSRHRYDDFEFTTYSVRI